MASEEDAASRTGLAGVGRKGPRHPCLRLAADAASIVWCGSRRRGNRTRRVRSIRREHTKRGPQAGPSWCGVPNV